MEELKKVQHEALGMDTGISEVRTVIEEAVFFGADSVCVPSCYMKEAKEYGKRIQAVTGNKSCSLFAAVGYPSGYAGTSIKKEEARQALLDGADGIRLYLNTGKLIDWEMTYIQREVSEIRELTSKTLIAVIDPEPLDKAGGTYEGKPSMYQPCPPWQTALRRLSWYALPQGQITLRTGLA